MFDGKRLLHLRKNANFTQAEMADKLNIRRETYTKYERGQILPPSDMILSISNLLNVSADYLFSISDSPIPIHKKNASPTIEDAKKVYEALVGIGALKPDVPLNEKQLDALTDVFKELKDYIRFKVDNVDDGGNVEMSEV